MSDKTKPTKKKKGWFILRDGEVYTFRITKAEASKALREFDLNGF